MAGFELATKIVCEKFKIKYLNNHQKQALRAFVCNKCDVLVNLPTGYGKSLIYQCLPVIFDVLNPEVQNHIIVVVSPLVNLIQDQVHNLTQLGIAAISLSAIKHEEEEDKMEIIKKVENGEFTVVYTTPESLIYNERWRKMLSNLVYSKKLCCIAVDEAHVLKQWGTSSTTDKAVFRECYARLHELRSLAPNLKIMALTATASKATKKSIVETLLMNDPYVVYDNPNKSNIAYSVTYMSRDESLQTYFEWLVKELLEFGINTRTFVYCQTIKQCSVVYSIIKALLGESMYVAGACGKNRVLVEMLHSCTPESNKDAVLKAFSQYVSEIRLLIATIAFGMGVDSKGVYRVIHFGPAKNIEAYIQETGRCGRDGKQSIAYLIYQGLLLNHVDNDIKNYVKTNECRRKVLMAQFDTNSNQAFNLEPKHLCCDRCASKCDCQDEDCGKLTLYPSGSTENQQNVQVSGASREVTEEQIKCLRSKLVSYHKSLVCELINKSPHGQLPTLTNLQFMLGFSDQQISQVIDKCSMIFSLEDIVSNVEIWHIKHGIKIIEIISSIFGDCATENVTITKTASYPDDDDDDNIWLHDWDVLINDQELFELAANNLSMSFMSASEHNISDDTIENENIPQAAVSALECLTLS